MDLQAPRIKAASVGSAQDCVHPRPSLCRGFGDSLHHIRQVGYFLPRTLLIVSWMCCRLEEAGWHTRRDVVLQLLQTLANFYPEAFRSEAALSKIPDMLDAKDDLHGARNSILACIYFNISLQLTRCSRFCLWLARASTPSFPSLDGSISTGLHDYFMIIGVFSQLRAPLERLMLSGSPWQAKQCVRSILCIFDNDTTFITKTFNVRGMLLCIVSCPYCLCCRPS